MTGRPPALEDVDNLDPGPVPLRNILDSARTIRRRRRNAALTATAAVAAVVVSGGMFATGQFEGGNVARDRAVADSPVRPVPVGLSVKVEVNELAGLDTHDAGGSARWDATSQTVIYESRDGYSSSCPPLGTATLSGQNVNLVLVRDTSYTECTADAPKITVTIGGLTTPPAQLAATENGGSDTTPVVNGDLGLPCDPADQRSTALDVSGPGRATPLKAVAQFTGENLVVDETGDSVVVHEVGPDGQVSRTFNVTRRDDGWWPVGWVECVGTPTTDPTDPKVPPVTVSPTETPTVGGTRPPDTTAVAAASAFVSFARGETTEVPWADSVRYTIVGTPVADLTREDAANPSAWAGCPTAPYTSRGIYEGRECPVSPIATIGFADEDGPVVIENQRPTTVGCTAYRPESDPPGTTLWIRPTTDTRDCFADFAISVTLNGSSEIAHVDLVVSGP